MNLQSVIDNARMRDNAVAEIKHVIDELDVSTLERVIAYAAERLEAVARGAPEPSMSERIRDMADEALRQQTAKTIARAEKGVRTRKANKNKKLSVGADKVARALQSDPKAGISAKEIAAQSKMTLSAIYGLLKKLGAYNNGSGRFWINKTAYLANFPIAGKRGSAAAKRLANGATTAP